MAMVVIPRGDQTVTQSTRFAQKPTTGTIRRHATGELAACGMKPICLWSGPRNVSTALMYSFREHRDIEVVDEPLYGHYLRVTGADHPGRDAVMAAMDCDGNAVMQVLLERAEQSTRRLFLKHMAHHLVDLDLQFLERTANVFLIRDPREMLPSLTIQLPHATLADTGLKRQWQLFETLQAAKNTAVVVDSRQLLLSPVEILGQLCDHLSLDFDSAMLSWPAGPRPEDGVWAPHWYDAVHQSTGFAPYRAKGEIADKLLPLLDECRPWYEKLYAHALRTAKEPASEPT